MSDWRRCLAAGAVSVVAAIHGADAAPLVYATVTGTVQDQNPGQSHDNLGFFAVPGSSLDGAAFEARFIFDIGLSTFGFNDGTFNGHSYSAGLGGITGSMTINGRSISFDSTGFMGGGTIDVGNGIAGIGDLARVRVFGNYNSQQLGVDLDIEVRSMLDDFISSADPTVPFSYTTGANTQFTFATLSIAEAIPGGGLNDLFAVLHTDTISFSTMGDPITAPFITEAERLTDDPVDMPEPATLAIIGLGLAGLTLARRRRAAI